MKPILYNERQVSFYTQGIGVLFDAVSCKVTETLNGIYELEMKYPEEGFYYKQIKHHRIILAKPNETDQAQPFVIYRITKPMNGLITVYAEHLRYRMSNIPVKPFYAGTVGAALLGLESNAVETCYFTFWTDKPLSQGSFNMTTPKSMLSILGGTEGSILDAFGGGDWKFDRWEAKLYARRGADNGVTIRYGKNLTDINQEENIANVITGILPYWINSDDATDIVMPESPVYYSNQSIYPYKRTVVMDFSQDFQSKPSLDDICEKAAAYIENNKTYEPDVSIKISFIALWQTEEYKDLYAVEHVELGDTIHVNFEKLDITAEARVLTTVYDSILERYDSIEVGNIKRTSLSKTISRAIDTATSSIRDGFVTRSYLDSAVENATSLITGGLGGYVVLNRNADGKPEEILILCDDDQQYIDDAYEDYTQARKLWRWNKGGLGYSSTGYTGEYGLAMTSDGKIVADAITTGVLNAGIIRAGTLGNPATGNYWDMVTGNFQMKGTMALGLHNAVIMQNGELHISATYIDTGTMSAARILGGTLKLGVVQSGGVNTSGALELYRLLTSNNTTKKFFRLSGYGLWMGADLPDTSGATTGDYNSASNFRINTSGQVYAKDFNVITGSYGSSTGGTITMNSEGFSTKNSKVDVDVLSYDWKEAYGDDEWDEIEDEDMYPYYPMDLYWPHHPQVGIRVNTHNASGTGRWASLSARGLFCDYWPVNGFRDSGKSHGAQYTADGFMLTDKGNPTTLTTNDCWIFATTSGGKRFTVVDGTHKNKLFRTKDYGSRYFYCYETPTPYFGDIGDGVVGDDGLCYISIDPMFSETVVMDQYQVFIQKYGNGDCWVKERKNDYFVVEGTPNLSFGWEIKAKQSDGDQLRMDKNFGEIKKDETDYALEAIWHIEDLTVDYEKEAEDHINEITDERRIPA